MKRLLHSILPILALFGTCTAALTEEPPLTARVKTVNGVPQLLVNGKPTIPRMLYSGLGCAPIRMEPGERQVSFTFTPMDSEEGAEIQFGLDSVPGEIVLDNIHVIDLADNRDVLPMAMFENPDEFARDWVLHTANKENPCVSAEVAPGAGEKGSSGLKITVTKPATGAMPYFNLHHKPTLKLEKGHQYRVDFWVKADAARKLGVSFYNPYRYPQHERSTFLGGLNEPLGTEVQLAAKSKVDFVTFPINVPWPKPGKQAETYDIDLVCNYILENNPKALLVPRIKIDAPQWWLDEHPDQAMQFKGPEPYPKGMVAVSSKLYRQEADAHLAALIEHLETKFGNHMAGYHITGQNSNEWFYVGVFNEILSGYAPADLVAWREWLRARYGTDADLQKAWSNDSVTLDQAEVPTYEARHARAGEFYDPVAQRPLVDWNQFRQENMAGAVCEFAHTVREKTGGRKLVLFFYGYLWEFARVRMGPPNAGHYAFRKVLDSPDIDILCSPISYFDRGTAGSAPAMTAAESVPLAGKLWLMEDDTSTHCSLLNPPGSEFRTKTLEESNHVLLRNGAQSALRNMGIWWMDLCQNGWFADPALWAAYDKWRPMEEEMLRLAKPFNPQIAAVVDEKSLLLLAPTSEPGGVGGPISFSREALGRVGAPYGQYLLDDVCAGRTPAVKLYVFLSAWRLSASERASLLKQTRGKLRLWGYAPGYFDNDKPSLEAMKELTGFKIAMVSPKSAEITPTQAGKKLGLTIPLGKTTPALRPTFAVTDAKGSEILATFEDGSAAVVLRKTREGSSLFVGTPALNSELLRVAARAAGVHLYCETDAAVYANGPFLAIHATADGPLKIDVGQAAAVTDVLTGKTVATQPRFELSLQKGQSQLLRIDAPNADSKTKHRKNSEIY